jgi:hypothetical protein
LKQVNLTAGGGFTTGFGSGCDSPDLGEASSLTSADKTDIGFSEGQSNNSLSVRK